MRLSGQTVPADLYLVYVASLGRPPLFIHCFFPCEAAVYFVSCLDDNGTFNLLLLYQEQG